MDDPADCALPQSHRETVRPGGRLPYDDVICPACGNSHLYRYGRTKNGKRRFLCLGCDRQFTPESTRRTFRIRPNCSSCGRTMHLYKHKERFDVFRCSDYPRCRNYLRQSVECGRERDNDEKRQ